MHSCLLWGSCVPRKNYRVKLNNNYDRQIIPIPVSPIKQTVTGDVARKDRDRSANYVSTIPKALPELRATRVQHNRERQREIGTERRDIPLGPCLVWSQLYALSDSIDSDHEAAAAEPAGFWWGRRQSVGANHAEQPPAGKSISANRPRDNH